jgi:flagellar protein FliS
MSTASFAAYRTRVVSDSVATASPARLLTMLYDRLLLDLSRAEAAQVAGNREVAGQQLQHAQDIVLELVSSLRPDEWEGGRQLAALYGFLHSELVRANVNDDPERTQACRLLVEPLAAAWHQAAMDPSAQQALTDRAR